MHAHGGRRCQGSPPAQVWGSIPLFTMLLILPNEGAGFSHSVAASALPGRSHAGPSKEQWCRQCADTPAGPAQPAPHLLLPLIHLLCAPWLLWIGLWLYCFPPRGRNRLNCDSRRTGLGPEQSCVVVPYPSGPVHPCVHLLVQQLHLCFGHHCLCFFSPFLCFLSVGSLCGMRGCCVLLQGVRRGARSLVCWFIPHSSLPHMDPQAFAYGSGLQRRSKH